jgi:WS/DGAT/MGAT family acyltransferase
VAGVAQAIGRAVGRADGDVLERPGADAPRTFLNGRISLHRRIATGSLSLTDVKTVKDAFGTTVNDVVAAVCAGALRRMLQDHQALPAKPLVAMMPVSVRTREQRGTYGNRISFMFAPIATDEHDPLRRLTRVHDVLRVTKERHRGTPATLMQDVNHLFPAPIFSRAVRATLGMARFDRVRPAANVVISNVPGSRTPLELAGARIISHHPLAQIYDGMGLNFSLFSYQNQLDFGIVADREMLDDVAPLMDDLRISLDELLAAAKRRR